MVFSCFFFFKQKAAIEMEALLEFRPLLFRSLHVTLGVIYLGVVALRRNFIPILLVLWLAAWLGTPAYSPFHYGAHVLLLAAIVCTIIVWLKPKVYDSSDVEVAGLYWHFVDLVWMFIFPLVYLMSAKIL